MITTLDVSRIKQYTTAGMQLLMVIAAMARERDITLEVVGNCSLLCDAAMQLGIDSTHLPVQEKSI